MFFKLSDCSVVHDASIVLVMSLVNPEHPFIFNFLP